MRKLSTKCAAAPPSISDFLVALTITNQFDEPTAKPSVGVEFNLSETVHNDLAKLDENPLMLEPTFVVQFCVWQRALS